MGQDARTAEQDDYMRLSELPSYVYFDVPDKADDLTGYIQPRQNCDKVWSPMASDTWGPELLELCKTSSMLILNGRTPGNEMGKYTFGTASSRRRSTIDYCIASAHCMFQHCLEDAFEYAADHHSVILHSYVKHCMEISPLTSASTAVTYHDQNAPVFLGT